jgi:hypothetical protein
MPAGRSVARSGSRSALSDKLKSDSGGNGSLRFDLSRVLALLCLHSFFVIILWR